MTLLSTSRTTAVLGTGLALAGALGAVVPAAAHPAARQAAAATTGSAARGYQEVPLVSDVAGLGRVTDASLVNPWGIAFGSTTPLWVSNEGTSTSTLYAGANGTDPIGALPLVVRTPPHPTGVAANPTTRFRVAGAPARFVFVTLGGQLAAWTFTPPAAPPTSTTVMWTQHGAVFTGVALARTRAGARLYAADAAGGAVRVYNGRFRPVRTIRDRTVPAPLAPYNVAVLGGRLYVSYALPEGVTTAGPEGAIDVFTLRGHLLRRLVTGGPLSGAWGMAVAPADWGRFSGDLLVGNEDGGAINAFDPATGHFEGALATPGGTPIAHDGMWGLAFGNGVIGTPRTLIFAAGIGEYGHGLVGAITPVRADD